MKKPEITPSMFITRPMDSVMQNAQCETIARNIMAILNRTGNKFRDLTWEEYEKERLKDGNFDAREKGFFEKVQYLCKGLKKDITGFSSVWKNTYDKTVELTKTEK